jgi:extracellular matrix protein 14
LEELGWGLAKAIRLSSGEEYGVASACEGAIFSKSTPSEAVNRMESAAGSAIDWFYHEMRVRYSYQIKLRDTGSYGFLLPSENIIPTGEEAYNAVKYFGDFLLSNKGIETKILDQLHRKGDVASKQKGVKTGSETKNVEPQAEEQREEGTEWELRRKMK